MALVACKECKAQVSTKAAACPHCGAKMPPRTSGCAKLAAIGFALFAVILMLGQCDGGSSLTTTPGGPEITPAPPPPPPAEPELLASIAAAKQESRHGDVVSLADQFLAAYPQSASAGAVAADREAAVPLHLAAVALQVSQARWSYPENQDQMTSAVTSHAITTSLNSFELGFPYTGRQSARLNLRKHPRYGIDVLVSVERGQILCDNYSNTTVNVRFDDEAPRRYGCDSPSSNESDVIFIENPRDFIRRAKRAERVLIELQFFQNPPVVLEFDTAGLDEARWPHG